MKAIFLDKDGTVIENCPFNVDPQKMRFMPGVREGLPRLSQAGFKLILISNQSGVALGRFPETALRTVEEKLRSLFEELGVPLDGFYYCPHHSEALVEEYRIDCSCQKPKPGLLLQAAEDFGLDLSQSWMLGDILHDVEAGRRAGVRTVLIDVGNETEWELSDLRRPHAWVRNFNEAVSQILADELNSEVRS